MRLKFERKKSPIVPIIVIHNVTELYNIIHFFYENLNHNQLIPN